MVYLTVVAATFLPLLLAAQYGPFPLWNAGDKGPPVPLTFLQDWGLVYVLVVSLPCLVMLLVRDEYALCTSLAAVEQDGLIELSDLEAGSFKDHWTQNFQKWNLISQVGGIVLGLVLAILTLRLYQKSQISSWLTPGGDLPLAAYVDIYCLTIIYTVVVIYVIRCIVIAFFFRALLREAHPLRILPLHPDKCGGLRPVGRLGLRNQYILTLLGINIVLNLVVWTYSMNRTGPFGEVMIAALAAYVILGPVIFMAPLLPFRSEMQYSKEKWTHEVAHVVRVEIGRFHTQIVENKVSKKDEESIERLRKISAAIDELPVWPFDPSTLRKFATAYVVPLAIPILGELMKRVLNLG